MIRFALVCEHDHEFEGWFGGNDDFERQSKTAMIACPVCGSTAVTKALMAPSVSTGKEKREVAVAAGAKQAELMRKMQELAREVRASSENVGERFAEEARKIHYGETDPRGIYGKASGEEVKGLIDEGVGVLPLPDLPEEQN